MTVEVMALPRIDAPTVAEHRRQQEAAILAAARDILAQTGRAPTLGEVAQAVGLARSSVYQYYSSSDDLLAAVVADIFPAWARHVREKVESQQDPAARIWAYIDANIELFASSEQVVAAALARVVDPAVLQEPMTRFHQELQQPLVAALAGYGESDPQRMAGIIDAVIMQACRPAWQGDGCETAVPATGTRAVIRRLIGGYLDLPSDE